MMEVYFTRLVKHIIGLGPSSIASRHKARQKAMASRSLSVTICFTHPGPRGWEAGRTPQLWLCNVYSVFSQYRWENWVSPLPIPWCNRLTPLHKHFNFITSPETRLEVMHGKRAGFLRFFAYFLISALFAEVVHTSTFGRQVIFMCPPVLFAFRCSNEPLYAQYVIGKAPVQKTQELISISHVHTPIR